MLGSTDTSAYRLIANALFSEGYNRYGLIYAENARNVFITGPGELNGQGSWFMDKPYQPKTVGRDFDRKFTRQGAEFLKPGSVVDDGPATYHFRPGLLVTMLHCENVRNLVFSNLVMYASNRRIDVFSRTNSRIEHVLFSNITIHNRLHSGHWWGKGEPIHLSAVRDAETGNAGTMRDIRFSNITATSEAGIVIQGSPGSRIEHIDLERIKLTINRGKYTETYGGNFDFRPAYPFDSALFKHDLPGLYAQHVAHLRLTDFTLTWGSGLPAFFTSGVAIDHFEDVRISDSFVTPAGDRPKRAAIRLTAPGPTCARRGPPKRGCWSKSRVSGRAGNGPRRRQAARWPAVRPGAAAA